MQAPKDITELLMYATARIEVHGSSGEVSRGTGFFYTFERGPSRYIPCFVTNKHVVRGGIRSRLVLHEADPADPDTRIAKSFTKVQSGPCADVFFDHPDPEIDLCAMPIMPMYNYSLTQGRPIYFRSFATSMIPSQPDLESLVAVEDLLMVGYPNALWDSVNNLPLFRRGISATHPAIDYEGKPIMVVDMACFPGSSGSPVLLYRPTDVPGVGQMPRLLGVLCSGPVYTAIGEIEVVDIPTTATPIAVMQTMMHLGFVIKAREIERIGDVIVQQMDAAIESGDKTPRFAVGESNPW